MTVEELAERVLQRRCAHYRARISTRDVYWLIACIVVAAVASGGIARLLA